jgi:hypothetical protein
MGQQTSKNGEEECKISPYPTQENITPTLVELQTQSSLGASEACGHGSKKWTNEHQMPNLECA